MEEFGKWMHFLFIKVVSGKFGRGMSFLRGKLALRPPTSLWSLFLFYPFFSSPLLVSFSFNHMTTPKATNSQSKIQVNFQRNWKLNLSQTPPHFPSRVPSFAALSSCDANENIPRRPLDKNNMEMPASMKLEEWRERLNIGARCIICKVWQMWKLNLGNPEPGRQEKYADFCRGEGGRPANKMTTGRYRANTASHRPYTFIHRWTLDKAF